MQTERLDSDTEISMMQLLGLFYQKKLVLLLTSILGLVIGFAVITFSKPVYEASIKLKAASEGDIAAFNLGRSWDNTPLKPMSVQDIYHLYRDALLSDSVKTTFFNQFYLPEVKEKYSTEQIYKSFVKNFSIVENHKSSIDRFVTYTVAIRGDNAQQVAIWLQQYIDVVREQTLNEVLNNIKKQNAVMVYNLQHQIDRLRETARVLRQEQIVQLKERIRLAQLATNDLFDSALNTPMPPNPEALRMKLKNLSEQKSDAASNPNVLKLQAELDFYKSLTVDPKAVAVFHLDGSIQEPTTPIAPKKKLTMMVWLVIGFMFGVFCVMFQIAWRKEQARKVVKN